MITDGFMWVECPQCGRKVFKVLQLGTFVIERKCAGCRGLINIRCDGRDVTTHMAEQGRYWPPKYETK